MIKFFDSVIIKLKKKKKKKMQKEKVGVLVGVLWLLVYFLFVSLLCFGEEKRYVFMQVLEGFLLSDFLFVSFDCKVMDDDDEFFK